MDELEIDVVADPDLDDPVLIEGLPGVGHVGTLAAEHVLEEFDDESTLVRRIYSTALPPQVSVEEGVASLTCTEVHAVTDTGGRDILVFTGEHQAQHGEGHYALAEAYLDVADALGATEGYALGGVPTGELIEEYDVIGAVTDATMIEDLEDAGVRFDDDEPAGGIVGISGLLLGLGARRDFPAACLMGETSGYLVDPKSARAVLSVLEARLGIELSYESLDERAEEMEAVVGKIREMESQASMDVPSDDDLRYIG